MVVEVKVKEEIKKEIKEHKKEQVEVGVLVHANNKMLLENIISDDIGNCYCCGLLFLGKDHHLDHLLGGTSGNFPQLLRDHLVENLREASLQLALIHLLLCRQNQVPIRIIVEFVFLLTGLIADSKHPVFKFLRPKHPTPAMLHQSPHSLNWVKL